MRSIHKDIKQLFGSHPWTVEETAWNKEKNKINETIFTVANGYLGIRGFLEEGFSEDDVYGDRTTMINGVYEYFPYNHIWCRPGFPQRFHTIVGQVNPFDFKIYVNGNKVDLSDGGKIKNYKRTLDLKSGVVSREFTYVDDVCVEFEFSRFASHENKHLAADRFTVKTNKACEIKIVSEFSVPGSNRSAKEEFGSVSGNVFSFVSSDKNDGVNVLEYKTIKSGFDIAFAAYDVYSQETEVKRETADGYIREERIFNSDNAFSLKVQRYVAYATGRDFENHVGEVQKIVLNAAKQGFNACLAASKKHIDAFWNREDIIVEGDDYVQQGLRFSAYEIFQSTGKDGITNISANGLTGTAYSGHTFWDTEVFIMPMYIYTHPEIAKQLIKYRYSILDKARERAAQMDDVGALYSWNSINGEECGHVFEAATAQYHINNDVFYAIYRYYEATEDKKFLFDYCAEILFEISKCMAHRGSFIPTRNNKFCINVICGPDEYNPVVDNNMYTNVLTQKQLYFTLKVASEMKAERPNAYKKLCKKCGVDDAELDLWQRAADNMYIPYSEELGMYMQDDNFIYKDPIDVDSIPKEKLPLLTHLHPLNLWRYQVCKQADIVLLTFICSDYFTLEERKKIFDYYEPKTIHDSSLSASIHSIVACDIGDTANAYGYLKQAVRMDLDNVNGNTYFGLHAACMGASWMMMVNGFAGLRVYDGKLHFDPFIHEGWDKYSFKLLFRGVWLEVSVDKVSVKYKILSGGPIEIKHKDVDCFIKSEVVFGLKGSK